jgi:predicted phage terminase large subunit-like protein
MTTDDMLTELELLVEVQARERYKGQLYLLPPPMPLARFVREAWPIVESSRYVHGWHIDAICQHLEALFQRRIRNLLINVPPRSTKSLTLIMFEAWAWTFVPSTRFLCASYSGDLSIFHAKLFLQLVQSDWYQQTFGIRWNTYCAPWELVGGARVPAEFVRNTAGGYRLATSVGAKATGFGGEILIGDDLHDINEDFSTSRADILHAVDWWQGVMSSRLNDATTGCRVVVGQRVAEDDVYGAVTKTGHYDVLCIPAQYDPDGPIPASKTVLKWKDPRTTPGESMCAARLSPTFLAEQRANLGHRYHALYQQSPQSAEDVLFRVEDWRYYEKMPPMDYFDIIVQSWDMALKDKSTSSYVAGHLWGKKDACMVLLDRVFEHADFPKTLRLFKDFCDKWPGPYPKLIEDKANGTPLYQMMRSKVPGIRAIDPSAHGGKVRRAQVVAPIQRARQAWLPAPTLCPWVVDYVERMRRFSADPSGDNDDTDATSQAWRMLGLPQAATDEDAIALQRRRQIEALKRQRTQRERVGEVYV